MLLKNSTFLIAPLNGATGQRVLQKTVEATHLIDATRRNTLITV